MIQTLSEIYHEEDEWEPTPFDGRDIDEPWEPEPMAVNFDTTYWRSTLVGVAIHEPGFDEPTTMSAWLLQRIFQS